MIKFLKTTSAWALSIITIIFTFVPETYFEKVKLLSKCSDEVNVILFRIMVFGVVLIVTISANVLYRILRRHVYIKGKNYSIMIEYKDIFKMKNCKRVIAFDECFSTNIGSLPSDIKPSSICGQYLQKNQISSMQSLIDNVQLKPMRSKSKFQNKNRYASGSIVLNGSDLLMAFAKLDETGSGRLSYDEFVDCLSLLWKEIDKYYGQNDVVIPILGSGITRLGDLSLTQQELLDIIIASYRLSSHKIKLPYKLHIACKKCDDFSLNKILENM